MQKNVVYLSDWTDEASLETYQDLAQVYYTRNLGLAAHLDPNAPYFLCVGGYSPAKKQFTPIVDEMLLQYPLPAPGGGLPKAVPRPLISGELIDCRWFRMLTISCLQLNL